ncbi:MAG: COX15/CtaA family protein [Actinomycetota bacterium]|nr:COX15/CtaA family protein [Actinomycetota bacterium]MDQ3679514.1 COX15/CtaA family protein [Actinomycetota bacterium]
MRAPTLSPSAYQRVTLVALLSLAFIIVTGGAVRLTGSGLGCPDWPNCDQGRLVAPLEYHALVEFVNRSITGLVSVAVILAVLGSLLRQPRRRDLVWLSVGLVGGVIGQIVLGGLTVLFELRPPFVMAHFLLSMVILGNAVVLHWRAGEPPRPSQPPAGAPPPPTVGPDIRRLGSVILATTALVVFLGTVVTAAGPHGGDEDVERLDVPLHRAAQLHGAAAMLLVTMVATMLFLLVRGPSPMEVRRQARILLGVVVAQAGIGYLQYFTGVPVLLVGAHIAGATALWATAVRFGLGLGHGRTAQSEHEGRAEAEADGRPEVFSASIDGAR